MDPRHLQAFLDLEDPAIDMATRAWHNARNARSHYNCFAVGSCLVAFHSDRDGYVLVPSVNLKPYQGKIPKSCSELGALSVAIGMGCTCVAGIVVVGQPRVEDSSHCLRPCEVCRPHLAGCTIVHPNTSIVCIHADDHHHREEFSVASLLTAYGESYPVR